jgi:triphosphoribosyl-dephospho-CoA synthase
MSRALTPHEISFLATAACLLELSAPKPGNVSRAADFDDTTFEDFLLSAAAIGPVLAGARGRGVGATILEATGATRRHVQSNTNLGMVLLLSPLASAAAGAGGTLRDRLSGVLAALSVDDARAAYAAIRMAAPGGLGQAEVQDVADEPTLTLREAMVLAAGDDTVAREYATDYDVTFRLTAPTLRRAREGGLGWPEAILEAYLRVLANVPDTLIARKQGANAARAVSLRAAEVLSESAPQTPARDRAVLALDEQLRGSGNALNPGTTADLITAGLFVVMAEDG